MSDKRILWRPNSDFQRRFLACSARFAMAGSGIGSGKTSAMLAAAASQTSHPLYRGAIYRLDFPSLRHIISTSIPLFAPLGARYSKNEHVWRFRSGAEISFNHLDDEIAMYQAAGAELQFLGFDECQQLAGDAVDAKGQPINSAFAYLQTRLRAPKDSGLRLEVRLAGTSWGRGVGWLKSFFRIPDSGEDTEFVDDAGFRRCFFKSTYEDNPALSEDYKRSLFNLPLAQQKALLHGDFSANVGQVFEEWSYARHVCQPFPIDATWPIWRGGDDGYASPCAVVWLAHDEIHDRLYLIAEMQARGLTATDMAHAVLKIDRSLLVDCEGEVICNDMDLDGELDASSFANIGSGSRGEEMNALGCRWRPSAKSPGSRVAGVNALHQRLALKDDGLPGLIVFNTCKHTIRTLPMLCASKANPDDVDTDSDDHLFDALRYGLTRKAPSKCKVMKVRWVVT